MLLIRFFSLNAYLLITTPNILYPCFLSGIALRSWHWPLMGIQKRNLTMMTLTLKTWTVCQLWQPGHLHLLHQVLQAGKWNWMPILIRYIWYYSYTLSEVMFSWHIGVRFFFRISLKSEKKIFRIDKNCGIDFYLIWKQSFMG